ncbi:hypothetical protein psyc5s11_06940 [Clostridium gelidum]|uniref:ABC-2 family transporter protein n=1 Tax=Clostridium gelidum TaxID=704125 RepID=A0ABM7T6P2_9CLOT|nr:ABC transporter permease [Clostridium gelidum]BCZ44627.1 hypothetical protein psyc5s11_06940 [Clostridium gelidum]
MSNLIRGEFYKLRKSKYFIGMIFLAMIVGVLFITLWEMDRETNLIYNNVRKNGAMSISYAYDRIAVGSFLFALLGGTFIIKDVNTGNLSKSFSYGYTRSKVILSKLIVFVIFSLFLELIYTAVLVIYVSKKHGFYENLNLNSILYLSAVIVSLILFSIATISIIGMVAILTSSVFITLVLPIIFWISIIFIYKNMGSHIFYILSSLPWLRPRGIFQSREENIISVISVVVTLAITIGGSLLYVKHKDIR